MVVDTKQDNCMKKKKKKKKSLWVVQTGNENVNDSKVREKPKKTRELKREKLKV